MVAMLRRPADEWQPRVLVDHQRLRELLGEATAMRVESANAHSDQAVRLDALLGVQVHYAATLQQSYRNHHVLL